MSGYGIFYILILLIQVEQDPILIYDFRQNQNLDGWKIVDDVVMGGRSDGNLKITESGNGLFYGTVSLENNGGFSSIRYKVPATANDIATTKTIKLRVKGDGKSYQFRIKKDRYDRYSYIITFDTDTDWEIIEIPLADLYPSFRGMELDLPNYTASTIEEISILISNKRKESFQLEIDWIKLSH